MRVKVDFVSSSRENYREFCKLHPSSTLSYEIWRKIIYAFTDAFRGYILETGEKIKLPQGFGEFSINKKKRKRIKTSPEGKEYINLPVDWKKSKEKHKKIYNFNFHTDGYFFGWQWFRQSARFRRADLWRFKASRETSRLIAHYLKSEEKYQHLYRQWLN